MVNLMNEKVKKCLEELEKIGDTFRLTFRPAEDALLTDFKIRYKHIPALIKVLQRVVEPKTQ